MLKIREKCSPKKVDRMLALFKAPTTKVRTVRIMIATAIHSTPRASNKYQSELTKQTRFMTE